MTDTLKYIVESLNKPPFNKHLTVISLDSLVQEDLLQILCDVLHKVDEQNKVDICMKDFEQLMAQISTALYVLRYPPIVDTVPNSFRQDLMAGEKTTIYALLEWLLSNMELLKRRAYLARFLIKVDVSSEILGDSDVAALYEQYTQLIDEFKQLHKESVLTRSGNKISISELRSDGVTMEKEKNIVTNRIYQIKKKIDHIPNSAAMLRSCHNLRTEMDRKKETIWQIQEETINGQRCGQRLYRLTQQLQELQKRSVGLTLQTLMKKLDEEVYVTGYIVEQKLPRELSRQKKEKEIYENVAYSNTVSKAANESLTAKVQTISQEINRLLENRLRTGSDTSSFDDKTALFQQQAAIIARKKDNLVEKCSKLKSELQEVQAKLPLEQQKLDDVVGRNGVILRDNEKFQEYVNKLRTRSSIYKRHRGDLAVLKTEGGVLWRTLDVLRAKAAKFGLDVDSLLNYGGMQLEDNTRGHSTDALMTLIAQTSAGIAALKAKLSTLVNRIKPLQQQLNEQLAVHADKNQVHNRMSITLNMSLTKLVNEVNAMHTEHSKVTMETALLASKVRIAKVELSRAQDEFEASVNKNNSTPLIRDRLNQKIVESEKLNRLLKEEKKAVCEEEPQYLRRKASWNNIQMLLHLKITCLQGEKAELESLVRLERGAETLVLW